MANAINDCTADRAEADFTDLAKRLDAKQPLHHDRAVELALLCIARAAVAIAHAAEAMVSNSKQPHVADHRKGK